MSAVVLADGELIDSAACRLFDAVRNRQRIERHADWADDVLRAFVAAYAADDAQALFDAFAASLSHLLGSDEARLHSAAVASARAALERGTPVGHARLNGGAL